MSSSQEVFFKPGEIILFEGDRADGLFFLEEGQVEVIKNETIVSVIKDKHTFFGEMSYLMKSRRTATLRAKSNVRALQINFLNNDESTRQKIAETSMELLRVMASRLDLANQEIRRLEKFEQFRNQCYAFATENTDSVLLDSLKEIDEKVNLQEKNKNYRLIRDYLRTPKVWNRLKTSILEIISYYTNIEFQVTSVHACENTIKKMEVTSSIKFFGDKRGQLILGMSKSLASTITKSFGLPDEDLSDPMSQDTVSEMANQILGQVKKNVKEYQILLDTPVYIPNQEVFESVLGDHPALEINMDSQQGALTFIFQIFLEQASQ